MIKQAMENPPIGDGPEFCGNVPITPMAEQALEVLKSDGEPGEIVQFPAELVIRNS